MRIAFVSLMRAFPWAGSEELWFRTAQYAIASGHTVCTLTQRWEKTPEKLETLRLLGAELNFYDAARYTIAEKVAIKLAIKRNVADVVPDVAADVYFFSNGSTWDFLYYAQITKQVIGHGKPYVILSQHNFENGHILKEEQRRYALQVMTKATKLMFVSERNRQAAERQMGARIDKFSVVNNPINITQVDVKQYPASATLLMACVARLECDFKGQDVLLQALSSTKWDERNFTLKLYGAGPHLSHLQYLIALYELQNKVFIEGHVRDVDAIWVENQVLILPSISEGTPLALVECMLSGRAAVTTDVGDNGRYVIDGVTGYLALTCSVSSIDESLERLWTNRDNLKRMGEAAFHHASAITDFRPEETVFRLIESGMSEK
ncbi:MAG TPA: glycosyltransferase family 4 protein [Hymenobacter sp.]|uniref:glycosyltransferase family 4 protein n=1 Tax=Hymenobacter sp. TaxID=1898978 RepID=UPI002EDACDF8